MDNHAYDQLLTSMCDEVGLGDRAAFLCDGLIVVDGLDVLLHRDAPMQPDVLEVRIDCGPVPTDCQKKTWHTLLVANFAGRPAGRRFFSVLPENDHVVLTASLPLSDALTGRQLADTLHALVCETKDNLRKIIEGNAPTVAFLMGQRAA